MSGSRTHDGTATEEARGGPPPSTRLTGWEIDGYGHFADASERDLPGAMVVFYGPNESGKSTLVAFVRTLLFGFPDGRSSEPRYQPLRGGRHGGRLHLQADGEALIVERHKGKRGEGSVSTAEGAAVDPSELSRLLGAADADLYRNVFAFGLTELESLASLKKKDVSKRIFSAGITGAGRSAQDAMAQLGDRADAIFKSTRSRTSRLQELTREIAAVDADIARAREASQGYAALARQEDEAKQRLVALHQDAVSNRERGERAAKLASLWKEVWGPLAATREAMAKLEEVESFPQDALQRLEKLDSSIEQLDQRATELADEKVRQSDQRDGLARDDAVSALGEAVERLAAERSLQAERLEKQKSLELKLEAAEKKVEQLLRDELGADWDEARVARFDASVTAIDQVRQFEKRLADASGAFDRARLLLAQLTRQAGWESKSAGTLEAECNEEYDLAAEALRLADSQVKDAPGAALPFTLGAAAAVAAAVAIGFAYSAPEGAGDVGSWRALALAAVVAFAAMLAAMRRSSKRGSTRLRAAQEREKLAAVEAKAKAARAYAAACRQLEGGEVDWRQWCRQAALPESMNPEQVRVFTEAVRRLRQDLLTRDGLRRDQESEAREIANWEAEARSLVEAAAEGAVGPASAPDELTGSLLLEGFDSLAKRCQAEGEASAERALIDRRIRDLESEQGSLHARRAQEQAKLAALFAEAGADGSEALRRRDQVLRERASLEEKARVSESQLLSRLGLGVEADAMRAELEQGRVAQWESDAAESAEQVKALAVQLEDAARLHENIERQLSTLKDSAALMDHQHRRAELWLELEQAVAEWRRLRMAIALIEQTLARFQDERQPMVLREASRLFALVTEGRYQSVAQSAEGEVFDVITAGGARKSPEELSRGTAEQLYLCVRLGLVAEFARRSRSLPVLMDDVLVNFDDARAAAAARLLAGFASEPGRQLLFFTCHSRTRDLMLAEAPEAEFRELSGVPSARS